MGTGGEGEVPPPVPSQAGEHPATAWLLPFYLLDQKLAYHFQRNRPQEYFYLANPTLPGAGAEGSGCSCHISATHPVLCVGQKLHPKPLPNRISAELTGPTPLHRAISRPNLVISHLPASPCSPLSNVSFVTFWAGRDANALWSFPLSQPRPVWHAARIRARPQEPQGPPREGCLVPMGPLVTCGALDP